MSVFQTINEKYSSFEKLNIYMIIYKTNVNWLCVCNDYLRQNCRVHIFTKKLLEVIDKKQANENQKIYGCKEIFRHHIHTFNEIDNFHSV